MELDQQLFRIGTVTGFRGLKGQVKVRPAINNLRLIADIQQVKINISDGSSLVVKVKSLEIANKAFLLQFVDYPDRNSVEFMQGASIFITADQLADLEEDEWWVSDLIGLVAYTQDKEKIGTIVDVIDSGTQILEISPEINVNGKTILVPFAKDLVSKVDIKHGFVEIANIPGLLEPQ